MDSAKGKGNKVDSSLGAGQDASNIDDEDYVYSSTANMLANMERTLFMVDLSRLKAERDTLENALVFYIPEADIKKTQYEHRCSQLVGLALCTMNFTGKYPQFLRLKGTSYAIRSLGEQYIIALSSRIEEPPSYCVQYLKTLTEVFRFYYNTPENVMEANNQEWEKYRKAMSQYVGNLLRFIIRDQHSVPAMLNPLPYFCTENSKPDTPRLDLLASHILRACQHHKSIIGGCILHCGKVVMSQFPPEITEKLTIIGGEGISLDKRTVLAENIAPGKVWVVEVYLTKAEENLATEHRKDHTSLKAAYSTLVTVPQFTSSTRMGTSALNLSTCGGGGLRPRGNWRRRVSQASTSKSQSCESGFSSPAGPPVSSSRSSESDTKHSPAAIASSKPLNSSTPIQDKSDKRKKESVHSEDAVTFSPGLSVVKFDATLSVTETVNSPDLPNTEDNQFRRTSSSSSSMRQDGDEYEYVDAVESIDPTQAITTHTATLVNPLSTSAVSQPQPISPSKRDTDTIFIDSRHCSVSSEGFTTPPGYNQTFSTPVSGSTVFYSVTHEDGSVEKKLDDDKGKEDKNEGRDTLTQEGRVGDVGKTINPNELTDEELSKIINSPMDNSNGNTVISSVTRNSKVMALPCSWTFKKSYDSDSDDDFVDSKYLQEMLSRKSIKAPHSSHSFRSSPPPALPPRNATRSHSQPPLAPRVSEGWPSLSAPPPIPPRNNCSSASPLNRTETLSDGVPDQDSPTLKVPAERPKTWLYMTIERGATGFGMEGGPGALKEYAEKEGLVSSEEFVPTLAKNVESEVCTAINEVDGRAIERTVSSSKDEVERNGFKTDHLVVEDSDTVIGETSSSTKQKEPPSPKTDQSKFVITDSKQVAKVVGVSDDQLSLENALDIDEDESDVGLLSPSAPDVGLLSPSVPDHQTVSSEEQEQNRDITNDDGVKLHTGQNSEHDVGCELYKTIDVGNQDTIEDESFVFRTPDEQESKDLSIRESGSILYQLGDEKKNIFTRVQATGVKSPEVFQPSDGELSYNVTCNNDGTLTPVERTYNPQSILHALPHKLTIPPMPPPRARGSPRKQTEDDAGKDISEDEQSAGEDSSDSDSNVTMMTRRSRRDTDWFTKSMKKKSGTRFSPDVKRMCLYVQQCMGTEIVLLADNGLHKNLTVLNMLWRSLLYQLMELEVELKKESSDSPPDSANKPPNYLVTYSSYDRRCEAVPHTAPYHFRHALRRIHQEYVNDPSLLQVSFSKEHLRILSQCVHKREVYLQPGRLGHLDALAMHGTIEKYAKTKNSLRQHPIGGPKVMFI